MSAFAKRNAFQFGVGFFKVCNRRHEARVQAAHGDSIFQPGTHRVPGETFGIADDYTADVFTKGGFKCIRFGTGGTAAGGRIGFVRDEHQLLGNIGTVQTVFLFCVGYQAVHHLGNVAHIQAGYVETAVGNFGGQEFSQRFHTAFGGFGFVFHNQGYRTHTHNHTVAAAVKRQGRFGNVGFRRSGAGGQEGRQNPLGHIIIGNIVCADDNYTFAAAEFNPILRHGNRLGSRGASRAHSRRRAAGANPLAEMAMGNNNGL